MFYIYDNVTKEFIGTNEGFIDPIDKNVIQPGFSTEIEPPVLPNTQVATFNGNGWNIIERISSDVSLPTIKLVGEKYINLNHDETYAELGATAFNHLGENISEDITVSSNMEGHLDGSYYVNYSVTDSVGTSEVMRSVYVAPNTKKPVIMLDVLSETLPFDSVYEEPAFFATDNRGVDISDEVVISWEPAYPNSEGEFTATYRVTDYRGVMTTAQKIVTLLPEDIDMTPPIITLLEGDVETGAITLGATEYYDDPGAFASDNKGANISKSIAVNYDIFYGEGTAGVYDVTYTCTDVRGVKSSKIRKVTVLAYTPEEQLAVDTALWKSIRRDMVSQIEVTFNGTVFQGDEISQERMSRTINALPTDTVTIPWTAKDNTVHDLTKLDLASMLLDAGTQQSIIWNVGRPTL